MRTLELGYSPCPKEVPGEPRTDVLRADVFRKYSSVLKAQFGELTKDALGNYPYTSILLKEMALGGMDFFVIASDGGTPLALGGYRFRKVVPMGTVMNESIKVVQKIAQGRHLGREITRAAIEHSGADFLTFETQNPAEIASVSSLLEEGSIAPIDFAYGSSEEYSGYLRAVCDEFSFFDVDTNTGISQWSYGYRLGDYELRAEERIIAIDTKMSALGLQRENGDSVRVLAKVAR